MNAGSSQHILSAWRWIYYRIGMTMVDAAAMRAKRRLHDGPMCRPDEIPLGGYLLNSE
jgi:hypothetical protein